MKLPVVICIALVAASVVTMCAGQSATKPGQILRDRCTKHQFKMAQPELLTARGTRVACALFVETGNVEKPFVIQVNESTGLIAGDVKDMGWFDGETKNCPRSNKDQCMTIINHPLTQMNGAIQFYSNPNYERRNFLCRWWRFFCPHPDKQRYLAVMDCLKPEEKESTPGQLYIVFETSDLTDTEITEMEDMYNFKLNKTALDECIESRAKAFPDPSKPLPRPTDSPSTTDTTSA